MDLPVLLGRWQAVSRCGLIDCKTLLSDCIAIGHIQFMQTTDNSGHLPPRCRLPVIMQDQRHVCISTHGLDGRLAVTPETSVELANVECRRQHFMD